MNKTWTPTEIKYLIDNSQKMTDEDLTLAFNKAFKKNVTKAALRKKRQRLKVKKKPGNGVCSVQDEKTTKRD